MKKIKIKDHWKANAIVDKHQYLSMYDESIKDNDSFWNKHGKRIDWIKDYTKIKEVK